MSDIGAHDLAELERFAGSILKSMKPAERRALFRKMARRLQKSQQQRIARQQNPDGSRFAPRKRPKEPVPGAYAVKFLYPSGGAGKLRRPSIRQRAMFRKIRRAGVMRAGGSDQEAWVAFAGRVAAVARIHQLGLFDKPSRNSPEIRYAMRELLGFSAGDRADLVDAVIDHVMDAAEPG